ncbi:hemolymph juvenile hormone binding protein (JHBP) [Popillia japonica]|uniref:Hemolymph juvenile hormone binding protein (JHBP) n=1 Tax=Popillia japonica TaxID=7064 RepID=A0AAW1HUY3_POPJA
MLWLLTLKDDNRSANIRDHTSIGHIQNIAIIPTTLAGRLWHSNITFVGSKCNFNSDFEEATRGGETYLHLKDYKLSYTTERIYFHLDNLFDGDSVLDPQVNKFEDENWIQVEKELGPSIVKATNFVIKSIVDGVFNSIPMNQIFLP